MTQVTQRHAAAQAAYWRKRSRALPWFRFLARRKAEREALYWEIMVQVLWPRQLKAALEEAAQKRRAEG